MELVYSIGKAGRLPRDVRREDGTLCSISCRNIVAFSSTMELLNHDSQGSQLTTYKVYVCDVDRPWDLYRITSCEEALVALEWDHDGTRLLLADAGGTFHIWSMKDYLLNDWNLTNTCVLPGEVVVAVSWLHRGLKVDLMVEKKDSPVYSEKIVRSKFLPSLAFLGGIPADGWIAVTSTGMVHIGLHRQNSSEVSLVSETLEPIRWHISVGDLAFDSSGDILILGSDGGIGSAIHCYRVSLKREQVNSCNIHCRPCKSLFAQCHMESSVKESLTAKVTHIKFRSREKVDTVVIAAGDSMGSSFELWQLKEQSFHVNKVFHPGVPTDGSLDIPRWICIASIRHSSLPVAIAVPRFPVVHVTPEAASPFLQCFSISYKDGALKLINANTFQPIATTNLDTGAVETDREKRQRVYPYMVMMQQTFTGCGIIGWDQFCTLYVMKAVNTRDPVTQMSPSFIVSMFEYTLNAGYDWWDVLLAIKPGMLEGVMQRLMENFERQGLSMQQLLYSRFMKIRAALYRIAPSGQQRATDVLTMVVLQSVASTFRSLLRPKTLMPQDKGPAERLSAICSSSPENDINKIKVALNPESDFMVEPPTLQALQQLIQWVVEVTLYLLSSLPMMHSRGSVSGVMVIKDTAVLVSLREMLVLIRMWGSFNAGCMPRLTTRSPSFDYLAHVFKLLTRVWLLVKEGSSLEHEETLFDECCLLSSQILMPPLEYSVVHDPQKQGTILSQTHTCKFSFGNVPDFAKGSQQMAILGGDRGSTQLRDIVHQIYLGTTMSEDLRQCSRCGSMAVRGSISKVPVMLAWEQRWASGCVCGGHWRLSVPGS